MEKIINPDTEMITAGGKTYKRKYNGRSCRGCAFCEPRGDEEDENDICFVDKFLGDTVIHCRSYIWVEAGENIHVINIPEGCEVDTITTEEDIVVVTLKQKEPQQTKTWEEFCKYNPIKEGECYIDGDSSIAKGDIGIREPKGDRSLLPDRATAEAVLALCQLIQLRNYYNQGWVPNWDDLMEHKYMIVFVDNKIVKNTAFSCAYYPLYFKTKELRDTFLENFHDLIEKLKPLYGIKEGGSYE